MAPVLKITRGKRTQNLQNLQLISDGKIIMAYILILKKAIPQRVNLGHLYQNLPTDKVGWIHLAQDRDQWRDFVSRVTNIWVP
jgi:hypothetical protein